MFKILYDYDYKCTKEPESSAHSEVGPLKGGLQTCLPHCPRRRRSTWERQHIIFIPWQADISPTVGHMECIRSRGAVVDVHRVARPVESPTEGTCRYDPCADRNGDAGDVKLE